MGLKEVVVDDEAGPEEGPEEGLKEVDPEDWVVDKVEPEEELVGEAVLPVPDPLLLLLATLDAVL